MCACILDFEIDQRTNQRLHRCTTYLLEAGSKMTISRGRACRHDRALYIIQIIQRLPLPLPGAGVQHATTGNFTRSLHKSVGPGVGRLNAGPPSGTSAVSPAN